MKQGAVPPDNDESIGDLFHQLVADTRDYVEAEINLYKETALDRAGKARTGATAIAAGAALAYAGLIAALVGLVLGLAPLIGPVAGGAVVLALAGLAGFLLIRFGTKALAAKREGPEA